MKYFGGWDIEEGGVVCASLARGLLRPLCEFSLEGIVQGEWSVGKLEAIIDTVENELKDHEKKQSFFTDRIYLKVPPYLVTTKRWEEIFPLRRGMKEKRITSKDIIIAKKQLEEIALEWDEKIIHHFTETYEVDGTSYVHPPVGLCGRKLKLSSYLVSMKHAVFEAVRETLEGGGRKLDGCVYSPLGDVSGAFSREDMRFKKVAVVNIRSKDTIVSFFAQGRLISLSAFSFGEDDLVRVLQKNLSLPYTIARELLERHFTFRQLPRSQEITIRSGNSYLNINSTTLNTYVKEALHDALGGIDKLLRDNLYHDATVSFIGAIVLREGFYDFLRDSFSFSFKVSPYKLRYLPAFGCIRYGMNKFLEDAHLRRAPMVNRLVSIYHEYF